MSDKTSKLIASDYVHLHAHTHYSLLDGLQKIPNMVKGAKELGMKSLAITDHGTLSGAIEFYKEAKKQDIKPVIGIEAYVAARDHTDKDPQKDKARYHLIILAMNAKGYENLMRLSTIAHLEGFYHKPRVDRNLLEKHNEGLIILSGCIGGELGDSLRNSQTDKAEETIRWYKKVFGDRYYVEIQDHGHEWDEQKRVNEQLLKLAKKHKVEAVLTSDSHYLKHEDQDAHEILLCVQTGSFLNDQGRMSLKDTELHLTDPIEIIERWPDNPEIISNSKIIADRCNVELDLGGILIPKFPLPKDEKSENKYLNKLVYRGLAHRYGGKEAENVKELSVEEAKKLISKEILERCKFELDVIESMGFDGYFLIVADFINWGKSRGIVFGPGRGSAAGSIVSYAMGITELDPLEYDLLFERFLNPDRISMPDIDIDIQDSRRHEVIQYCVDKYGEDRVAHIVTFGKMAARNAIRDVARVLEVPYGDADRLAKLVPPPVQGRHIPLATSIVEDEDLKNEYENNEVSRKVIDQAIKLEGTIRSHGVHAAAVVIAPEEIVKYTPLEMAQKGVTATQYSMHPIEELGLLKMDFLGLSNLTTIKNTTRIVSAVNGEDIDISKVPLDDLKTYELFSRGDTTGVFQLESGGMKRYIKMLQPTLFEDIVAMVALYRPGPMQYIEEFIDRKHGRKKVEYLHDRLENSLKNTYGIIVYQEQVMQIAKDFCGFSGGQADTLRKAVGKKNAKLMAEMKDIFIEGGVETSKVNKKLMETLWAQIEEFAAYGFVKAHAACYGMIAYWTAYLKAHFPSAFMAALMTSDYDDTDRLAIEISECRAMGIEVLPPDVNESYLEFGLAKDNSAIRFGMLAIKNVGTGAVEEILNARKDSGEFKSVEDFVSRVSTRVVNRKAWESLIKSGAFDSLNDRQTLLLNLDTILAFGAKIQKEIASGQTDLFGGTQEGSVAVLAPKLQLDQPTIELNERESLTWERELLGIYLSKHPLDGYDSFFEEKTVAISDITTRMDNKSVTVGGVVSTVREITTKKGSKMAFVGLEDKTGDLELIVFPNAYNESPEIWQQDNVVIAKGKINTKDREGNSTQEIKVMVDEATEVLEEELKNFKSSGKKINKPKEVHTAESAKKTLKAEDKLYIHVKKPDDNDSLLALKKILNDFPGKMETIIVLGIGDKKSAIKLPFKVKLNEDLKSKISEIYDKDCVAVR